MKINLIDFILGKFKSLKNDIKLLEKNKANNIDLELLRGYNISSYEFLIVEGYPLKLATYKENVEDGANSNKRYINIDKDISKVTVNTDIIISFIYEKNGEKKIYQKFEKYSTDRFIDTIQLPFIEGNPSIQISLYKNKQYNKNFEQVDSNKCSVLLNYGKKEADIIDEIDEVYFKISIRDRNVLTKDNALEYTPTGDYHPATKKYVDDNAVILPLPIHTIQESTSVTMNVVNIMDLIPGVQYSTHNDPNETKKQGYKVVYICDDGNFKTICSMPLPNKVVHLVKVLHYTNYSMLSVNNTAYKVDYSKHSILTDVQITKTLQYYLPITNTIEYEPTNDYHPATKKYVDDRFICSDSMENVGTIPKEEMQKCNNGTSRYVSSINLKEFFADYKYCVYQGTYGDKNIRMKYDPQYNRILAYDLDTIDTYDITLGFEFNNNYMYPFNAGASQVKSYQFTNDLVITKSNILNPSEVLTKNNIHEYTPTNDYNPATKKYVDDSILIEQIPILRIDESNKRIYINCNNMGTYKKYFVPNKYANTYGFSFIYTNDDNSETEIALVGGAMTRDDFVLCARNTNTLFILILGGTDRYTYTKSTKTLEKGLYGYLKIGNTQEYTPTENYHPSTKKYVDDSLNNMFTFNESGELVVTINGVSKTFVPKE